MSEQTNGQGSAPASQHDLEDMVAAAESGARHPTGITNAIILRGLLLWSIFQLWIASPLPVMCAKFIPLLNNSHTRPIHLAFAIFLTFLAFPAFKKSPRAYVPLVDWVFALVGCASALYLAVFADAIASRPGLPNTTDLVLSGIGLLFLLEATRRALGPPLAIMATVFLAYIFFGEHAPDIIAWKGASISRAMSHLWLTQEGVFGIAIGVSTSMVFLFVLFGGMLEKAGAGNYFIRVAFALLGHMRGGPAKAAVVSSALTGLVSGSSIANVVTTGTFTIPLMKKVGFPPEKAGAVEVASSVNGQLMPPVMGAAAFLMVEFVGISYVDVIKHAFLPAVIAYIALVYIVHLEACKAGMKGLPKRTDSPLVQRLIAYAMTIIGVIILSGVIYYGMGWLKDVVPDATPYIAGTVLLAAYVGLVSYSCRFPDLPMVQSIEELPQVGPTVKAGLYYLLPVVVLVWCLVVERLSPGLSAFWASVFMMFILITQRPLRNVFRKDLDMGDCWRQGLHDLHEGMLAGARNMVGIGVATAAAGIIVGAVTLTGVGQVVTEMMEFLSGGNLLILLFLTAVASIVLGMGLPTTANYIVVSSLMAQVIVTVGAQQGLIVPLIAVHMFVFYFGILADDTPPVGLAAFAAAAISGGDPIKTGWQGFMYDIRTAALPFMFIFNTELLMIGIDNAGEFVIVVISAVTAVLLFAAATQGYFLVRSKLWETAALLLIAFTLFRPGFWMDMIAPPLKSVPAATIEQAAEEIPAGGQIIVHFKGETVEGDEVEKTVMLPVGPKGSGKERLKHAGLNLVNKDGKILVDKVEFGSAAEKQKIGFEWQVISVQEETDRPSKHWMFIPALGLLAFVVFVQKGRQRREQAAAA